MASASRFSMSATISMIDKVSRPMGKAGESVTGFSNKMQKQFRKAEGSAFSFGSVVKRTLAAGAIYKGFGLLKSGIGSFITEASKIEDAVAGFTPLMGNTKKATELVERLNEEAASTPFQFEGIASVASQLLPVMNGSIEDTANTFRMLGDTAGGNIQKLDSITRGYTKALLKGKPDMEALNMIGEAGVPIFTEMAKTMGINVKQLFEMSKKGKLTNKDLTQTFKNMTAEGGIFFKGMEIASKTFTGKMSTLKDNISLTAGAIGFKMLPFLKKYIDTITGATKNIRLWVENNKELIAQKIGLFFNTISTVVKNLIPIIKTFFKTIWFIIPFIPMLVKGFLAYRAALLSVKIVQMSIIGIGWIKYLYAMRSIVLLAAQGHWLHVKALIAEKIAIISSVMATIKKITATVWSKVVMIASTIAQWAMTAATTAWNIVVAVATIATWGFGAAVAFLTSPIALVILGILALVAIGYILYDNWGVISEFLIGTWTMIKDVFWASISWITDKLNAFVNYFLEKVASVKKIFGFEGNVNVNGGAVGQTTAQGAPAGGFASPQSRTITNNNNTTTNGRLGIDITAPKGIAAVSQSGQMPQGLMLNTGLDG